MSIEQLKDSLQDYAKDIKLNLGTVITTAQGLQPNQAYGIALACAYATRSEGVVNSIEGEVQDKTSQEEKYAAKAAASIMAMNNIYYRAIHLAEDEDLGKMPAGLRMSVIGNPGIDKVDFELYSLAVSAINGCGACVASHVAQAQHAGVTKQGVQSALKIAAVINAAAQALFIDK